MCMLRRTALRGLGGFGIATVFTAYVYRPQPWTKPPQDFLSEHPEKGETILMKSARAITFAAGTAAFSLLMHVLNSFELKEDEHYEALQRNIVARPPGVPLLTVANHCSPLDDPGVLVAMLPKGVVMRPEAMRWTICAQEICFKSEAAAVMFGLAKTLPIARGEGIDQRKFLNFYRRLASGGWCHIFPEGHCEQDGALGGRPPGPARDKLGRLKWGVGKLIAHSMVPPVVIPIFHTGMAHVVPVNPLTRKILHAIPRSGQRVTARVGPAVDFQDLMEDYVRRHGPLRKLAARSAYPKLEQGGEGDEGVGKVCGDEGAILPAGEVGDEMWKSTPEERALYSKIARRIEDALLKLEAAARRDLGEDYPGIPAERIAILDRQRAGSGD